MTSTFPPRTKRLGSKLVAYLLGIEVDQASQMLSGKLPLTDEQIAVVQRCEVTLAQIANSRQSNLVLESHDVRVLTSNLSANERSIFSELRLSPSESNDPPSDAAERALSDICAECYPFTLLPKNSVDTFPAAFDLPEFFGTNRLAAFINAVRADPSIMKLFPDGAPDDFSQSRTICNSFGKEFAIQLSRLHCNIVQAAVALMHMHGNSCVADLQMHAIEMLRAVRRLAEGEEIQLPIVDTYDLIGLPVRTEISFGDGILKAIPDDFVRSIPRIARPANDRNNNTLGCMLIRNVTFSTFLAPTEYNSEVGDYWPLEKTKFREDDFDVVSLVTGLALDDAKATAARPRAAITIDPLCGVGRSWTSSTVSLGKHHLATDAECQRIQELLCLVEGMDTKPIQTAAKRFIGASINRNDVEDSLIDAVVGLESLFGARAEIAFHVSSGVSRLLGSDDEEREELFKSTKRIYDARSKIVHGSQKDLKKIDVPAVRERALSDLKKCIATLIERRQDLLDLDTATRVRTLVLRN